MRTKIFLLGVLLSLFSCEKSKTEIIDYREEITGNYEGIEVTTYWVDTVVGYGHDTSNVEVALTASKLDSIVDIHFNPSYSNLDFSFIYKDGELISTTSYHAPTLIINNGSLYFKHQPGLGPVWTEIFAQKQN